MEFVIVNGVVCKKKDALDGSFLWNQPLAVTQDVWFGYGGIPLLNENLLSLSGQLASLGKKLPPLFKNQRELFRLCKRMLNKNKYFRSGHLRFQVFVSDDKTAWLVEAIPYETLEFPFRENGQLAEISSINKLSSNLLNEFRCHNRMLWEAAKVKAGTTAILPVFLNEKGMVCEAGEANIFLMKKGVLITPSLESGCYRDVMRQIVIDQASATKIPVIESAEIDAKMLLAADEIFQVSESRGVEWILGIDNKRFVRNYASLLHEKVDDYLRDKAK